MLTNPQPGLLSKEFLTRPHQSLSNYTFCKGRRYGAGLQQLANEPKGLTQGDVVVELFDRRPEAKKLGGPVQFFSKLLDMWSIADLQSACILLGYEKSTVGRAREILAGRAQLETRDEKDRIAELFVIRKTLHSVFRDPGVENQWLREPQDVLDGKSPLDLLLEGSWSNLLRVRQFVELMAGL